MGKGGLASWCGRGAVLRVANWTGGRSERGIKMGGGVRVGLLLCSRFCGGSGLPAIDQNSPGASPLLPSNSPYGRGLWVAKSWQAARKLTVLALWLHLYPIHAPSQQARQPSGSS